MGQEGRIACRIQFTVDLHLSALLIEVGRARALTDSNLEQCFSPLEIGSIV